MPKRRKILTKEEIEKIAEYQWASVKDIMDIGAIGRNKANWMELKDIALK